MESVASFSVQVEQGDFLMSWDFKSGYRHLRLHPDMRNYFLFHYNGAFYLCIALPFGWGPSALLFTKILRPVVRYIRQNWGWRVLPYLDDFLLAPSRIGRAGTAADCALARGRLDCFFRRLGLSRHPSKGCWQGAQKLEHLGVHLDTVSMRVTVSDTKVQRVRWLARRVIAVAHRNQRSVSLRLLRQFCGVCTSLSLAYPLARFHTRALYFDMAAAERSSREERGQSPQRRRAREPERCLIPRVRLSRTALRDLAEWRRFVAGDGRALRPEPATMAMHSDASNVGYGGTLGRDLQAGVPGTWSFQKFWTPDDRDQSITLRELRAVRLLLFKGFARFVARQEVRRLLLHEDNRAVVSVVNAMVSASKPMMDELRKLHALLKAYGISLDARWIPSAVNKYADSFSRMWDPGDVRASEKLVTDLGRQYATDCLSFHYRPFNEPRPARRKYAIELLNTRWDDGRARLWVPPFDLLPVVLHKLRVEGGHGLLLSPHWPAQGWYNMLQHLSSRLHVLPVASDQVVSNRRANPAWRLVVAEIQCEPTGPPESTPRSFQRQDTTPPPGEPRKPLV